MLTFDVTYDIVTPESAEQGDYEELGFIAKGVCLRDAIEAVRDTRTSQVAGIEAIEPSSVGRNFDFDWIRVVNGMEYETGAQESRTLHIPRHATPSTRARILRLVSQ
jgi:hypothetical protein